MDAKYLNIWAFRLAKRYSHSKFEFKTGKLAKLSDGCVTLNIGNTSVMVTAVSSKKLTLNSFMPLTVDYRQKSAAAGRIPTNYLRRDLGLADKEILTSRMIDRSIRPLFNYGHPYGYETQIVCNLLAVDGINDPDVATINGASAALMLSDIPWNGPVAATRLGMIDGEVIINPTRREQLVSKMNLVLTGMDQNKIVMLEGHGDEMSIQDVAKAIKAGMKEISLILKDINLLAKRYGKEKRKINIPLTSLQQSSYEGIRSNILDYLNEYGASNQLEDVLTNYNLDKLSRDSEITNLRTSWVEMIKERFENPDSTIVSEIITSLIKDKFRNLILTRETRCDGRQLDELREITCEVDLYKPLHGSALFTRGQTQVLCTVTFDSLDAAFKSDPISILTGAIKEKNFMLHYEFPPYATNEIGKTGFVGRRELGHGALAEKALRSVIPAGYPFTIRLTSEVLESNGSSSMASCCGGSLALLDAGVPISNSVAGVAIGLVTQSSPDSDTQTPDYKILTDILGIEDYFGDMDFKMAGTKRGITALQADIKIPGISLQVVQESLEKGKHAINRILKIMNSTITSPNLEKDNQPLSEKLVIPLIKRAKFMGYGGYNVKKIISDTGVQITPVDETTFAVFAPNKTAMDEAREKIRELLAETNTADPNFEFGSIVSAKIVEIRDIGIMVLLHPTMQPTLLPNSQLDVRKIRHATVLGLEVGQEILVKYFGRDPVTGNIRISRKVLISTNPSLVSSIANKNAQSNKPSSKIVTTLVN